MPYKFPDALKCMPPFRRNDVFGRTSRSNFSSPRPRSFGEMTPPSLDAGKIEGARLFFYNFSSLRAPARALLPHCAISNVTMSPGEAQLQSNFSLTFPSRPLSSPLACSHARRISPVKPKSTAKPSLPRVTLFEARICSSST